MRPPHQRSEVARLLRDGLSDSAIARTTGLPRSTVRDWRRTGVLDEPERRSCSTCGGAAHDPATLDRAAYAYLLGLYLGDGHISACGRGVHRLRICVDADHPALADGIATTIGTVMPGRRVALHRLPKDRMVVVSQYAKAWPCLLPQHGAGVKHARRIVLVDWQQAVVDDHPDQLVRGLLHSDGWRGENRIVAGGKTYVYGRHQLSNRSDDIRGLFCAALDRLEVPWRAMNGWTISIAQRDAVAAVDAFVERKR